jgi:chaperonin GroES
MLKPLNKRIIVKPDEAETVTKSGIILAEAKEKPMTGTVVVGNSVTGVGARVLFSRFGYDEFEYNGETLYLVSENTILAIL